MKKVLIITMITISLMFVAHTSYASSYFIDKLAGNDKVNAGQIDDEIIKKAGSVYTTVQSVGIIVALLVTVASGVQWIVATPAKKAELKGKMIAIVVGVALILLASTLVGLVGNMWQNTLVK